MTEDQPYYVYAVVPADTTPPPGLAGLRGAPVEVIQHDGVAAIVSAIDPDQPLGRRADLLAYSRVVDMFATLTAVVPIRFGAVLPRRGDVVGGVLEPGNARFRELLGELDGRAQFNLRGRYDETAILTEVVTENPAIAELREQTRDQSEAATYYSRIRLGELVAQALAEKREAESLRILDALVPHTVAHNMRDGEGVDHLVDVAFLVDDERRDAFEQAAESAAKSLHGRATLRLIGPLAPYDFVTEE